MINPEPSHGRGKPLGYRSNKHLHDDIMQKLKDDKDAHGDGLTAFAISKALAVPDPTIRQYLDDLLLEKKVSSRRIAGMCLYRIHRSFKE